MAPVSVMDTAIAGLQDISVGVRALLARVHRLEAAVREGCRLCAGAVPEFDPVPRMVEEGGLRSWRHDFKSGAALEPHAWWWPCALSATAHAALQR